MKTAMSQPRRSIRLIEFGPLAEALDEHCAATGERLTTVVRRGVARELGQMRLLKDEPKVGRPRKSDAARTSPE